jgi:hypothetical protein
MSKKPSGKNPSSGQVEKSWIASLPTQGLPGQVVSSPPSSSFNLNEMISRLSAGERVIVEVLSTSQPSSLANIFSLSTYRKLTAFIESLSKYGLILVVALGGAATWALLGSTRISKIRGSRGLFTHLTWH